MPRAVPGEVILPTNVGDTTAYGAITIAYLDSGSGTYFGVDPKLDMIYILLVQTQNERGRITPAFRKLVYDAFATDN